VTCTVEISFQNGRGIVRLLSKVIGARARGHKLSEIDTGVGTKLGTVETMSKLER